MLSWAMKIAQRILCLPQLAPTRKCRGLLSFRRFHRSRHRIVVRVIPVYIVAAAGDGLGL
jgi:hypothetical protein